ncbi:ABC transporter substrate-binding protein [Prescottella sp. R16]|uniref:ABC transporter substrate-binding protein n=1 Tax=Prescottella sp. R16 TaxID=3064529 RepID=UPI00272EDF18|nr:ABC transporter substrate-binding protein [Prescottella sp. R16]
MNRAFRRHVVTVALAAAALVTITACSAPAESTSSHEAVSQLPDGLSLAGPVGTPEAKPLSSPTTIKVGLPAKSETIAPLLLAHAAGEFEKENLTVEYVSDTAPNLLTLLGQKKVDVVYSAPTALVLNVSNQGVDLTWAGGLASSWTDSGLFLGAKFGSNAAEFDPKKLEGATIGVFPGGLTAPVSYPIYQALTDGGLTGDDVTLTTISDPTTMLQALNTGTIDGAVFAPPNSAGAMRNGAFLAYPYRSDISTGGYFVGSRLMVEDRVAGVAFFRAMLRTINTHLTGDYHADADVVANLSAEMGLEPAAITASPSLEFSLDVLPNSVEAIQEMYSEMAPDALSYEGVTSQGEIVDLSLVIDAAEGR